MLISVDRDESRAALVKNGRLTHLEIEPINIDSVKGNIYRGVVARVEPSLQSAFVDFGRDKQGFLPVGEIHKRLRKESHDKRTPIQDILRAGQQILVQVVRDEIGNKGATLSTYVSLPGRYLVLMPQSDKSGVSRKLSDSARARVKELTEAMNVPEGIGLIVRTSGETATKLALTRDLVYLNRLWKHIEKEFAAGKGACPMYIERSMPIRFVRDYFNKDVDEIVIDDESTVNEIGAYLKLLMPRTLRAVERYSGAMPLFARYGILGQVEAVFSRQVPLDGGGSIVIDQTEALVAIDVNSGRVKGKDIEETARRTNIEAAREVARQLVLRDLGGLVVVDFIDMRERKYVKEVESTLKSEMKKDKARHKIGRISEFGLMELSRQRLKSAVHRSAFESCRYCSGTGQYRTIPSLTSSIIRRIYEMITQRPVRHVIAMLPPEAANFLLNNRRSELVAVETEYGIGIEIVPVEGMTAAQVTLEHFEEVPRRGGMEVLHENRLRRVTQHLDLVRNRVLKREDQDIERKIKKSKAAAMVDWGAVYKDVEEQTAAVEDTPIQPKKKRRSRGGKSKQGGDRKQSGQTEEVEQAAQPAPAPTPAPAPESYPPLPQKSGFSGWLKSIFGLGTAAPEPTRVAEPTVSAPAQLPAPEEEVAAAPEEEVAAEAATEEEEPRRRRRRRRRGRNRDGERDRDGERRDGEREARGDGRRGGRKKAEKSADGADNERKEADSAQEDGGEGEGRRRRRRRRRRRGGRDRDEQGNEQGQQGQESAEAAGDKPAGDEAARDEQAAKKAAGSDATRADSTRADATRADATRADATSKNAKASRKPARKKAGDAGTPPPMPGATGDVGSPPPMPAPAPEPVMADVTSLARAEIERLKAAAGGAAAAVQAEDDDVAAPQAAPAEAAASDATGSEAEPVAEEDADNVEEAAASDEGEVAAQAESTDGADDAVEAAEEEPADDSEAVAAAAEVPEGAEAEAAEASDDDSNGAEAAAAAEEETVAPPLPRSNPYVIDLRGNSGS